MDYTTTLVIGDWSDDGHCMKDFVSFKVSHPEDEIKAAYWKAVEKSGVAVHSQGYGEIPYAEQHILCEYEDDMIPPDAREALAKIGVDFSAGCLKELVDYFGDGEAYQASSCHVPFIFMEMVKTQIPGFEYEEVERVPTLNGYWSKDFNIGFGYGCYQ